MPVVLINIFKITLVMPKSSLIINLCHMTHTVYMVSQLAFLYHAILDGSFTDLLFQFWIALGKQYSPANIIENRHIIYPENGSLLDCLVNIDTGDGLSSYDK